MKSGDRPEKHGLFGSFLLYKQGGLFYMYMYLSMYIMYLMSSPNGHARKFVYNALVSIIGSIK